MCAIHAGSIKIVSPVLLCAMNDAGNLLAMIGSDRQNVVIAIHRGIGIAQDLAEFRIAQEPANFGLDSIFENFQLLPDFCQFGA